MLKREVIVSDVNEYKPRNISDVLFIFLTVINLLFAASISSFFIGKNYGYRQCTQEAVIESSYSR